MKISILTICPEMFDALLKDHVVDRAIALGQLELEITDIRDYAGGCFRKVDDSPYGGGTGMILRIEPVLGAIEAVSEGSAGCCVAALTPGGEPYDQKKARSLLAYRHLVLVCGHYEGMDHRIYEHVNCRLSIGDYILSGGEIAAMAVVDSVSRLLPGVLKEGSLREESFTFEEGILEYPQYTRPAEYRGEKVPPVLLSGNHAAIEEWRRTQARKRTLENRPDLLS